ncbi:MAG TPA: carboxypeptidase regulatory-like domain-containing protein, partial [Pyrinomonadaceae bacterium]|nr:carboxypeptidase regulatory-like domain-containing protein [Pyrinomonadaceae bacterium]
AVRTVESLTADRVENFTAQLEKYEVWGRVVNVNNYGLGGVTVTLTGGRSATVVTNAEGYYTFGEVAALGAYRVTPVLKYHTLEPEAQTISSLTGRREGSFVARQNRHSIGGRVTEASGAGMSGVTVTLTGVQGATSATTMTDAAGNYSFANLPAGDNYIVTPTRANFTFNPASLVFDGLNTNQTGNFNATLNTYNLSGRITDGANNALSGVTVALSGAQSKVATTDTNGNYFIAGLSGGGNYTLTPSRAHYTFAPPSQSLSNLSGDRTTNFTATLNTFSISGHIDAAGNANLSGVTVTLTGSQPSTTTTTDASGNYSFANLPAGANYTVTPAKQNYTFAPAGANFSNLSANQSANFTATLNSQAIGGRVTDGGGNPLANATLSLTGARTSSVLSDANGNYTFSNLPAGNTYTVTPSLANYTFTPSSRTFDNLSADQKADFGGSLNLYKVSGRIVVGTDGLAGATVTLSGTRSSTTTTDANGNYTFADLPAGGNYVVTPSRSHYAFNPVSLPFNNLSANQTGNFAATLNAYMLGGRISDAARTALAGVTVVLTGSQSATTTTDAAGNYSFAGVAAGGNYTITPSLAHHTFSPANLALVNLGGDRTGADFSGALNRYFIGGRVADSGGTALAGVTLELRGDQSATTATDAGGNYSFPGLSAGGNYTVTASKQNYTFTPPLKAFASLSSDEPRADFTAEAVPKTVQFRQASYEVSEGSARATLVVTRTGDTSEAASVEYVFQDSAEGVPCTATDGTANARCDYYSSTNLITFAPGEATKEIVIQLIDDAHVEGAETLRLRLANATGATLDAQSAATLVIQDNDTTAGQNPIFTTPFFIRMQYLDFLSREPEAGEPWSAILDGCSDVNNNPACDRMLVSQSFFGSPEFRLKGFYAFNFYRVAFGRRPAYEEIIPDMRSLTGATAEETYRKRAAFTVSFTQSAEFKDLYGALTDAAFVNALLNRHELQQITTPDPTNPEGGVKVTWTRAELVGRLGATGAGSLSRAQVLRAVVESDEVASAEYNRAFVAMQYYGYLRRSPEEEGYQAWLKVINQDPNNIRIMINGFMNSTEYQLRFGTPKANGSANGTTVR